MRFVFILLGIAIAALPVLDFYAYLSIQKNPVTADATVTETRTQDELRIGTTYQARYLFVVDTNEYTASDYFGRRNLWIRLPENVWRNAKSTNTVSIKYQATNPWNNMEATRPFDYGASLLLFIMGISNILFWSLNKRLFNKK